MTSPFGVAQRLDFRVRPARPAMPASTDDFALLYQHGADYRIRRSPAITPACEAQSKTHQERSGSLSVRLCQWVAERQLLVQFVSHSSNNAAANSFASNGCKSSGC